MFCPPGPFMTTLNRFLPFRGDPISRRFSIIVGLLVFVCTLALAASMFLYSAGDTWRKNMSETLTVEVPENVAKGNVVDRIIAILINSPNIVSAAIVSKRKVDKLVEPWLGSSISELDLPLPVLVDVRVFPGKSVNIEGLSSKLKKIAPGLILDDHSNWFLDDWENFNFVKRIYFTVIAVIILFTVGIVILTTHIGLAINNDIVEVLHLFGAPDFYVVQKFQIQTLLSLGPSVITGFMAAAGTVGITQIYGAKVGDGLSPDFTLSLTQWASLAALPFFMTLLLIVTIGVTVRYRLGKMM